MPFYRIVQNPSGLPTASQLPYLAGEPMDSVNLVGQGLAPAVEMKCKIMRSEEYKRLILLCFV